MSSQVGICKLALGHIGSRAITSLSEGSEEAEACNVYYDQARRATLAAHPWDFARKVVALAASAADPEYGFTYRYALPTDCLRPVELTNLAGIGASPFGGRADGVRRVAFKIMGRDLLTNMENARLAYTRDEEDPNVFSVLFIEALSYRLAAFLAGKLAESSGFQKNMLAMFQQILPQAQGVDAATSRTDERPNVVSVRA